jgi:hypothetical protein
MKSILYVGATLMIGASIYGFVDYKKASHEKKFTGMYEEKTVSQSADVTVTDPVNAVTTSIENTPVKNEEKLKQETKAVSLGKQSTATVFKKKKWKKFKAEYFSRAPIRDEVVVDKVLIEKKEDKKADTKEQ